MDISLIQPIARIAAPWADLYGDSPLIQMGVLFAHFAGLLVAGGFAMATDRLALRSSRPGGPSRAQALEEIRAVHRPVLVGLAVVTVTGLAMALADAEYLLTSTIFWFKMAAFAALLANGLVMVRVERRLRDSAHRVPSRRLRFPPIPSLSTALAAGGGSGPIALWPPAAVLAMAPFRVPTALRTGPGPDAAAPDDPAPGSALAGVPGRAAPESVGTRDHDPAAWRGLRNAALRSMALWGLTLLLGTALTLA